MDWDFRILLRSSPSKITLKKACRYSEFVELSYMFKHFAKNDVRRIFEDEFLMGNDDSRTSFGWCVFQPPSMYQLSLDWWPFSSHQTSCRNSSSTWFDAAIFNQKESWQDSSHWRHLNLSAVIDNSVDLDVNYAHGGHKSPEIPIRNGEPNLVMSDDEQKSQSEWGTKTDK